MRFNKVVGTLAAATISLAAFTSAANAQAPLVSFGGDQPTVTDVTFTSNGAGGGTLFTAAGGSAISLTSGPLGNFEPDPEAFFSFTPLSLISTTVNVVDDPDTIRSVFDGGVKTFTITSGLNGTGTNFLTGTFNQIILTGDVGGGTAQGRIGFNGVTYTSGTLLTQFLGVNPGDGAVGNFVLNLLTLTAPAGSPAPLGVGVGGGLGSFSATQISGNFNATATVIPEPSEWLAMGMAATSVGGLMFRAKLKLRAKRQGQTAA